MRFTPHADGIDRYLHHRAAILRRLIPGGDTRGGETSRADGGRNDERAGAPSEYRMNRLTLRFPDATEQRFAMVDRERQVQQDRITLSAGAVVIASAGVLYWQLLPGNIGVIVAQQSALAAACAVALVVLSFWPGYEAMRSTLLAASTVGAGFAFVGVAVRLPTTFGMAFSVVAALITMLYSLVFVGAALARTATACAAVVASGLSAAAIAGVPWEHKVFAWVGLFSGYFSALANGYYVEWWRRRDFGLRERQAAQDDALRREDERRRQELTRAAAIQRGLLPTTVQGWPGVLEIAARFRPAVETSGDFYDVFELRASADRSRAMQIAVADVAGKGIAAALVTALARAALRPVAAGGGGISPAATASTASMGLHQDVGSSHFVACALAVVEHTAGAPGPKLRLVNAGQPPVLLCRGGAAVEHDPPGPRLPLGALAGVDYRDLEEQLGAGDVVVFASDGLVEAPAQAQFSPRAHLASAAKVGELFGFDRMARSAAYWSTEAATAEAVAEGIWSDVTAWCGDESHHDDMTLLVLRVP